jgi:L-arabonate dehydrase
LLPLLSGTAFGSVILHTSPEAAAGGVLAVVKNGGINKLKFLLNGIQP